uniref:Uncharacterized protein n=1 Tax=Scleropages formosus TaxID=113540 RepID=A0A8C9TDK2_SCLFO
MVCYLCNVPHAPGLSVALTSTLTPAVSEQDLQPCLTQEKNLQMDCIFVLSNSTTQSHCQFLQDGKLLGSTDPGDLPTHPSFKNTTSLNITEDGKCRLFLFQQNISLPRNYTCELRRQKNTEQKKININHSFLRSPEFTVSKTNASFAIQFVLARASIKIFKSPLAQSEILKTEMQKSLHCRNIVYVIS